MSNIYKFFKLVTLLTNSMENSRLLITKSVVCVALSYNLHHEQEIRVNKSSYCFSTSESSTRNEFEKKYSLLNHEKCYAIKQTVIEIPIVMLWDIQESFGKGNSKFNFLGIIWGRKRSRRVNFFKLSESLKLKVLATMEPRPRYTGLITNL